MKTKYTANWDVQIAGMIFQTRSRACLRNAPEENCDNFIKQKKFSTL
ncbi:hypothetical protein EUBHAL_01063 [Anaerobutyricum hallii DSM 3353]|uniref:Uncharacterized protein n=1 Tax=Anaerobutyricum hallii DSM 3353 TaxID=411469 RepID=C0EUH9_9FIRM|nr:hypothetical protein EUBHAL_01063 [Anaerobutyricum hallii DSM 3353]